MEAYFCNFMKILLVYFVFTLTLHRIEMSCSSRMFDFAYAFWHFSGIM